MQQAMRLGIIATLVFLGFVSALACRNRTMSAVAQSPNSEDLKLGLGAFNKLAGTAILSAPAFIVSDERAFYESMRSGSKEGQIRNYFFLNTADLSNQWLLPHSNFLFVTFQEYPLGLVEHSDRAKEKAAEAKPAQVSKLLYYELVKANTNDNKVLDEQDRKTIALSDISGSNYLELINDIDVLLHREVQNNDELLVIYRKSGKSFAAKINLSQRQVITTKELVTIPKIQQPLS